jgi:hypothetical protein
VVERRAKEEERYRDTRVPLFQFASAREFWSGWSCLPPLR